MLFSKRFRMAVMACAALIIGTVPSVAERIDRGSQTIDGTSVRTIYHERGYAIFENDCGSQRLTQSALQSGAKPTEIIPCPRRTTSAPPPTSPPSSSPSEPFTGKRLWSAVAAGIDDGLITDRVSVGHAKNHDTRAAAERAAVRKCQEDVPSCRVVQAWNAGCYYITVSKNARPVAWGAGPTARAAYEACYERIKSGNCDTQTLGGCYPN